MKKINGSHIAKARASLIIDQPFFASLLLPMPIKEDNSIPTFATDGDSIVYNSEWAASLTMDETIFVLAHEVMHCVLDHMGRRGARTPNRWNQAADYVINQTLSDERVGSMPKGGLLNRDLVTRGNGTSEGVYNLLPESSEENGAGESGGALDQVHDAGSNQGQDKVDSATQAQKSAEMKVRVIQAKNAAKMQGKLSVGLERLIDDLLKPVVDWKTVLRKFVSERAKIDYTFARPKRRFLGEDLYLPSLSGQQMGHVVIPIDCSGSISQSVLAVFATEINAIREDVHPSKITVMYFDSEVLKIETFERDQEVILTPIGGGGTAFSPVFEAIDSLSEQPVAAIVLTDLCCDDFGPIPNYPVLWASTTEDQETPFGDVVYINSTDEEN